MLAPNIPDVLEPFDPSGKDRSELIACIRELERRHSTFELRVRVCEEKEQLWKNFMRDMGIILAATFAQCHSAISRQAEEAANLTEQLKIVAQNVENM